MECAVKSGPLKGDHYKQVPITFQGWNSFRLPTADYFFLILFFRGNMCIILDSFGIPHAFSRSFRISHRPVGKACLMLRLASAYCHRDPTPWEPPLQSTDSVESRSVREHIKEQFLKWYCRQHKRSHSFKSRAFREPSFLRAELFESRCLKEPKLKRASLLKSQYL